MAAAMQYRQTQSDSDDSSSYESDDDALSDSDLPSVKVNRNVRPYMFEPLAREAKQPRDEQTAEAAPMPSRTGNTNWCTCECCVVMENEIESKCCREIPNIKEKGDYDCITHHPGFEGVCLNVWGLEVAYFNYRQVYGAMEKPLHDKYRYTAYRQLVRWCWGYLGKERRVPIPSCAVHKIRQTFPSNDGVYKGFEWPDLS